MSRSKGGRRGVARGHRSVTWNFMEGGVVGARESTTQLRGCAGVALDHRGALSGGFLLKGSAIKKKLIYLFSRPAFPALLKQTHGKKRDFFAPTCARTSHKSRKSRGPSQQESYILLLQCTLFTTSTEQLQQVLSYGGSSHKYKQLSRLLYLEDLLKICCTIH